MTPDEVMSDVSARVYEPAVIDRIVDGIIADGRAAWTAEDFAIMCDTSTVVELIYNSAFVRGAARRGCVFYIGPDACVHRQALNDPGAQPRHQQSAGTADFYEPEWFPALKMFVDAGSSVLLIGPPGSGKTMACEQLFAQRDQTLRVVSCTPSMTADDLEGRVELRNDNGVATTRFEPSALANASQLGQAILLDEADAIPAKATFGLFRLLDGRDMRIQRMGDAGIIPRHDDFRIVGTQNTEGRGDDKGLHHGRSYQDEAWLDRWDNTIRVDYFPEEVEQGILENASGASPNDASKIVSGAALLRRALSEDKIMVCCSIRRTIAIAKNIAAGLTPFAAWNYGLLNRATREDSSLIAEQILTRVYGNKWAG